MSVAFNFSAVLSLFLFALLVRSFPQNESGSMTNGTNATMLSSAELGIDSTFAVDVIMDTSSTFFQNHLFLYAIAVKAAAQFAVLAPGDKADPVTLYYPDISPFRLGFSGQEIGDPFDAVVATWGLYYMMQRFPTQTSIQGCRVKLILYGHLVGWIVFTLDRPPAGIAETGDSVLKIKNSTGLVLSHRKVLETDMLGGTDQNYLFYTEYSFGGARVLIEDFYILLAGALVNLASRDANSRFQAPILNFRGDAKIQVSEVSLRRREPFLLNRYAITTMSKAVDAALADREIGPYQEFEMSLWVQRPVRARDTELGKINIWTVNAPTDQMEGGSISIL